MDQAKLLNKNMAALGQGSGQRKFNGNFAVGLLLRGTFRRTLELAKWQNSIDDFFEEKRWFESVFYIRGMSEAFKTHLDYVAQSMRQVQ